jgi:DNA-binding transcriptional LysR family regulator
METNRLRQFCTVFETSNIRQSAEILGISHGALSKSIKILEEEIGVKLFIPEGRGITSTDKAQEIYLKSKKIVESIDNLTISQEAIKTNTLKIASFEVFTTYFLNYMNNDLPGLHLEMHELIQGKLELAVKNGTVDLGITYEPIPTQGVEFLAIKKIMTSPYIKNGSFKNINILGIPFAAPLQPIIGAPTGVKGLDGWPEHKFPREIKYKVDMMESAIELCRNGHCAIFIPDFIADIHNKIVKSSFSLKKLSYPKGMKKIERTIYLVKKKNVPESSQMKKMAKYLRSI